MGFTGKTSYGCDNGFRQLNRDTAFSGTSVVASDEPKIDFEKLKAFSAKARMELAKSFEGVPVVIDRSLTGLKYYIGVSPELLAEIEKNADSGPEIAHTVGAQNT